jgi:hypothetical protein
MRDFKSPATSGESGLGNGEPITFTIDGDEVTAYPPKDGQMMLFMAAQAEGRDVTVGIAAIVDFLDGIFNENGRVLLRRRLMDREDTFGMAQVMDIISYLFEEWTARPTESPRGSTPSRPTTGRKSTARPRSKVSA